VSCAYKNLLKVIIVVFTTVFIGHMHIDMFNCMSYVYIFRFFYFSFHLLVYLRFLLLLLFVVLATDW